MSVLERAVIWAILAGIEQERSRRELSLEVLQCHFDLWVAFGHVEWLAGR